jgi:hypothetical protein
VRKCVLKPAFEQVTDQADVVTEAQNAVNSGPGALNATLPLFLADAPHAHLILNTIQEKDGRATIDTRANNSSAQKAERMISINSRHR